MFCNIKAGLAGWQACPTAGQLPTFKQLWDAGLGSVLACAPADCRSTWERQFQNQKQFVLPLAIPMHPDFNHCQTQDSDRFWHVPPPAAEALQGVLENDEVVVAFAWSILRSNPAVSSHGGPLCHGTTNVTLSQQSRTELLDILQVGPSL